MCRSDNQANSLLCEAAPFLSGAGIENAAFECRLLLQTACRVSREELLRGLGRAITPEEERRFRALCARRARREPMAYLRGEQEFFGRAFAVTPEALIPRPETELLAELAIEEVGGRPGAAVADACTGSGCVAVTVAAERPGVRVVATDLSPAALRVAAQNAERHGVSAQVALIHADGLAPVRESAFEMIIANPPYIPSGEISDLQPEVSRYEPRAALDGGRDGLVIVRRLARQSLSALRPGGFLAIEVAMGQAQEVCRLLCESGYVRVSLHRDLAGIERVVSSRKPA